MSSAIDCPDERTDAPPRGLPDGWRLERTTARNIHLLVPLFREVFGLKVTEDDLLRKHTTPWTKEGHFYGVALLDASGRAVAHQAGIPFRVRFGDRLVLAAQSCDSMTSAELRGKGFFPTLIAAVDRLLAEEGFAFIWGYANERSLPVFRKVGYRPLDRFRGYRVRVETLPLERICRRVRVLRPAYRALVDLAFRGRQVAMPIPSSCIDENHAGVERDEACYAYRRFSFNRRVRFAGVPVWFKLDGALWLGEIGPTDDDGFLRMMSELRRTCRRLGIDEILFQASPGTRAEALFSRHFPSFESWFPLYRDLAGSVDASTFRTTLGDLDTF